MAPGNRCGAHGSTCWRPGTCEDGTAMFPPFDGMVVPVANGNRALSTQADDRSRAFTSRLAISRTVLSMPLQASALYLRLRCATSAPPICRSVIVSVLCSVPHNQCRITRPFAMRPKMTFAETNGRYQNAYFVKARHLAVAHAGSIFSPRSLYCCQRNQET